MVHSRVIERFLEKNGSELASAMNSLGQRPLHVASKAGCTTSCLLLFQNEALTLEYDDYGYTPLSRAVWNQTDSLPGCSFMMTLVMQLYYDI